MVVRGRSFCVCLGDKDVALTDQLSQLWPIGPSYDVTDAFRSAAAAGMVLPAIQVEPVVEGKLIPLLDPAPGHNPNMPADDLRLAVGVARVVDEPREVPLHAAV